MSVITADYLNASNGAGDAALMHILSNRLTGSTSIAVDDVTNVPEKFIATSGTILASGYIDPSTKTDFFGHLSGTTLEIDGFCPGFTDTGNTAGQGVVIKPTTSWADFVADFIQSLSASGGLMPTGSITDFAGTSTPTGWLLCYGQAVSRTTYAALFSAIGTVYGVGDGSTTFNLPDERGRVRAGLDNMGGVAASRLTGTPSQGVNGGTVGNVGGEQAHALTSGENGAHTHSANPPSATSGSSGSHSHTYSAWRQGTYPGGNIISSGFQYGNPPISTGTTSSGGAHTHSVDIPSFTTGSTGSGTGHNNVQPTIIHNVIIKT